MEMTEERPKILMVDDKPENLVVLDKLLAPLNAQLFKATCGNNALTLTLEHDFVLILLDVQMPGMDGYEVLDMLSWDDRTKYIPVIFITANYADEKHQLKGYRYGAVDYLFKPINEQILLSKVKVFLELYEQKQQYKQLQKRYQLILDSAGEGVFGLDLDGTIIFTNPAAAKLLNTDVDTLINQPFGNMLKAKNEKSFEWKSSDLCNTLNEGNVLYKDDDLFIKANQEELPVEYTASPIHNEAGNVTGIVLVFSDITLRKTVEAQLTHMALYDHLTQLPNRVLFEKTINRALARAERHKRLVSVMFLDLDHFKTINDTLGHDIGDLLLQGVSKRLKTCVRESDTIARLGGDEFAIVLDEIDKAEDAAIVAEKIIEVLKPPFQLNSHEVFASTSIGIAVYPMSGSDSVTLTKNADIAMYRAKHQGRNNFRFFSNGMNKESVQRLNLTHGLRHALEHNELFVCYQPIFDLKQKIISGLEALLRWNHPKLGIVPPNDFLPIAEEMSLMTPIGEWVLRSACQQGKQWIDSTPGLESISVNISSSQLLQKDFLPMVERCLEETHFNANCLQLEITETSIMTNASRSAELLHEIRSLGIKIAIDDFGTGYSSLSYLKSLPVSTLKIDCSFIQDIFNDMDDATIVKTIIALGKNMNLKTIAEGVETQEQYNFLENEHCDEIQGFLFCKPLPDDQITNFLKQAQAHQL